MRRTIAEADMLGFVQLTGLLEELWLDAGKAEATGLYTGRLVPGYLTLTFAEGLVVLTGMMRGAVGMLGVTDIKWPAPVICGDTIPAEIEVLEARLSKNRARGVVVTEHRVRNQDDAIVLSYKSVRLIGTASGESAA
jgi:acyl dehydratase